jgi:hypothetical protein
MPTPCYKQLFKAAVAVHAEYQRALLPATVTLLSDLFFAECQRLQRLIAIAKRNGSNRIAANLNADYRRYVRHISGELTKLESELQTQCVERSVPSLREIYEDLVALQREFFQVTFSRSDLQLRVVTEKIELESEDLGRYEIQLDCDSLAQEFPDYRVVSDDGTNSVPDSEVCHPHVQGEELCAGDGRPGIESALKQGRLLDFFQIVDRVLHTYNPGSAFVSLDVWNGIWCRDCGHAAAENHISRCTECSAHVCDDCNAECCCCLGSLCGSCGERCQTCEEVACENCLQTCTSCSKFHCNSCLDGRSICKTCQSNAVESPSDKTGTSVTPILCD